MSTESDDLLLLEVKDGFATITINTPAKYNAMTSQMYIDLASLLRRVDERDDCYLTIITGKGKFFSAGADVKAVRESAATTSDVRSATIARLSQGNMNLCHSLYEHKNILVAALNGPAIGLSAAMTGFCDFVYAVENAYILTPFSTLSLVAEGGTSISFPRRMGFAKANEALIMGKKLGAGELQQNGYINKIFPSSSDAVFRTSITAYLQEKFSDLDRDAIRQTKALIKSSLPNPDASNLREIFAGAERFATGRPQEEFAKMAAKTKRHKL